MAQLAASTVHSINTAAETTTINPAVGFGGRVGFDIAIGFAQLLIHCDLPNIFVWAAKNQEVDQPTSDFLAL